jgi:hypothetical protein
MKTAARAEANKSMVHSTIHWRFTMKRLIIAVMFAAMAAFATDARAIDFTLPFPGSSPFIIGATHNDGLAFTDTFNFTGITGLVSVDVSLTTVGNIDFLTAVLNGPVSLTLLTAPEKAFTVNQLVTAGPFLQLVVTGGTGKGTYGGPVSVTSVPEPASLMLLGAGLAAIGIWRRKAGKV